MQNNKISALIVNYHTYDYLNKLIEDLSVCTLIDEIIVIDNKHINKEIKKIKSIIHLKIFSFKENLGYAKSVNLGVRNSKNNFILILNADVKIISGSIQKLFTFLQKHKNAYGVAPKLLNEDSSLQKSVYDFPTLFWVLIHLFKIKTFVPQILQHFLKKYFTYYRTFTNPLKIQWATGAVWLIKKESFNKIGYFDENYFLYFEEIDFCKRAHNTGLDFYYYPKVSAIHYLSKSSEKVKYLSLFSRYQSMIYYFKKYYGITGYLWTKFWIKFIFLMKLIFALINIRSSNQKLIKTYLKILKL